MSPHSASAADRDEAADIERFASYGAVLVESIDQSLTAWVTEQITVRTDALDAQIPRLVGLDAEFFAPLPQGRRLETGRAGFW